MLILDSEIEEESEEDEDYIPSEDWKKVVRAIFSKNLDKLIFKNPSTFFFFFTTCIYVDKVEVSPFVTFKCWVDIQISPKTFRCLSFYKLKSWYRKNWPLLSKLAFKPRLGIQISELVLNQSFVRL